MPLCTISEEGFQDPAGLAFSTFTPSYLYKVCNICVLLCELSVQIQGQNTITNNNGQIIGLAELRAA